MQSVDSIRYIATDGTAITLNPDTDFIVDRISEPGRIFPPHGQRWPAALHVCNSIEITYTAGYDPNPAADPDVHEIAGASNQQPAYTKMFSRQQIASHLEILEDGPPSALLNEAFPQSSWSERLSQSNDHLRPGLPMRVSRG